MLSSRQKKIISYLLQDKNFITIKKLSDFFHLSERSIQYDIENIEFFAEKQGAKVIRNKRSGVKLISSSVLEAQLFDEQELEMVLSPQERQEKILITLLETLKPVSSNQLSKILFVTRRTVVEDMKEVQILVEKYALSLRYVKNKGFCVDGDERKIRELYVEVLIKHYQSQTFFSKLDILKTSEIALIQRSIDLVLENENYSVMQTARDGLVFHIAITIHRVRNQFQISMQEQELAKLRNKKEFNIAKHIQATVEKHFELKFPESEIGYITLHLLGAKQPELELEQREKHSFIETLNTFIRNVSGFIGVDLTSDEVLLSGLIVHLKPALYRMYYQMRNDNPLKEEIEHRYPNIINAVNANLSTLEDEFQVKFDENEIAYLSLHIGSAMERNLEKTRYRLRAVIMCASGVGTSQLLKSKIQNFYPELSICDTLPVSDIDGDYFKQQKIDLVITTLPTSTLPIPVVKVSPFLTKDDRGRLNNQLNIEREKAIESGLSNRPSINELLASDCVEWNVEATDWKEAIYIAGELLIKKGMITKDYPKAIVKQLEKNGPYMVIDKGVVMPHAKPSDGVQHTGFSIIKLKYPIPFGHERYDPVSFIICLATTDSYIHSNALRQLSMMLQDKTKMEQIKAGNKQNFLRFINQLSQL